RGVARLAERLVNANRAVEKSDAVTAAAQAEAASGASEETPGLLDRLGTMEDTIPRMVQTVESIGRDIENIGRIMQEGAADMERGNQQAAGFAARLIVARKVARLLSEPVERIWSFGNEFASQLHEVDQGVRLLIDQSTREVQENPESRVGWCTFFGGV